MPLLDTVGACVEEHVGITTHSHAWCGHLVHYDPAETTTAIERVLAEKDTPIVVSETWPARCADAHSCEPTTT
jgi:hypothetical protein